MTSELQAPDRSGADTGPKRSRTKTVLPWLVVAVWIGLVVGGFSLAGKLDSVTRDGQADYLPASAQSTKVLQAEAELPGGENGLLVVVYERPGGLQPGDREVVERGYTDLAERFGNDTDAPPEILESDDGFHPHRLGHTAAHRWLAAGGSEAGLMAIAGA